MAPTEDRSENLAQARALLDQAMDRKADLIVYPEHFSFYSANAETMGTEAREKKSSVAVESLQEWSIEFGIWILAGALPLSPNTRTKPKPTTVVWDIDGDSVCTATHAGNGKIKAAPTPWGWLGVGHSLQDLHRPEAFQFSAQRKPIAWILTGAHSSKTDKTRWEVLTRARAIETGIPVFAGANCSNETAPNDLLGHSRIVDAQGRVIAERPRGPGIIWADVQPSGPH
jgi:predicted amidohydrolase